LLFPQHPAFLYHTKLLFFYLKVIRNQEGHSVQSIEFEQKPAVKTKNHVVLKFVLATLVLVLLSILLYQTGLLKIFFSKKCMANFLQSLGQWSFLGFIGLQITQVVIAPIPGDVTGLIGGYLYGPWLGIIWSTIGLTIGSYIAFELARTFGKPFVKKWVPDKFMERFRFLLTHRGAFIVFLLFFLPGFPKDYLCYILGLGEFSALEFTVISGVGRLFGTVLLTLGGNYIRLHQYVQFSVVCGVALVAFALALAFKDKLDRSFRYWNIKNLRRKRRLSAGTF
jgi:uncharacterized membrane protein YdjX (TVP38/TMEM64 family)